MENREIDRLIAEKVMGWKLEKTFEEDCYLYDEWVSGNERIAVDVFKPSSNIQDAWIVLEKFKEKDFLYTVQNQMGGDYEVSLTDWGGMCSTYRGVNEFLPLAVCEATLKAKGIEL